MLFEDRGRRGKKLTGHIKQFVSHTDVNLFVLPRGGAAVASSRVSRAIIAACHYGVMDTLHDLHGKVDEAIAFKEPLYYGSVGQYYVHFPQVADDEVLRLLA